MIGDETGVRDLEAQMDLAMEGVRKVVLRLLQDGEVHPQLVVLAVARVAGELGAGIAQAGGPDPATIPAQRTQGRHGPRDDPGRRDQGRAEGRSHASRDATGRRAARGRERLNATFSTYTYQ